MSKRILYLMAFLIKGWEVSILLLLPIFVSQHKISLFDLGLLSGLFSVFQLSGSFFAGHLSEKFGNKKVMLFGLVLYALAWSSIFLSSSIFLLSLICIVCGFGTGIFIPLANSIIAKSTTKNLAKEMGDFNAFTDLGRVLLSSLSAFVLGIFGIGALSIIYGLSAFLLVLLFIKFHLRVREHTLEEIKPAAEFKILTHIKEPKFFYAVISGMSDAFASSSLYIFIPLLLLPKGIAIATTGLLSSLFFVGYMSGRLILGRLASKFGEEKVVIFSDISMAALILSLIFVNNFFLVAGILFILGIFTRGTSPVIRAMVAKSTNDKTKYDKVFSFYSFSVSSANVTSRTISGFIASTLGINSVFYLSSLVALLTVIPIYKYSRIKTDDAK